MGEIDVDIYICRSPSSIASSSYYISSSHIRLRL
jgi:hypothetical protein